MLHHQIMQVKHELWVLVSILINTELVHLVSHCVIMGIVDIELSISWLFPLLWQQ
jgi:hypothetical protein